MNCLRILCRFIEGNANTDGKRTVVCHLNAGSCLVM